MAKKKKRKKQKPRIPKANYQRPLSQIHPIRISGPRGYLMRAREYPILGCWVYADWKDSGIAPVVVARKQSDDRVIFGVCLVDIYCLGVKDAFTNADISLSKFQKELPGLCNGAPQPCSVEFAHELIFGALEYAERYGFKPNPDFTRQMVDRVLDPPDMHPRNHKIEFGKDGKPFFMAGPYDDERRCQRIIATLERTAGRDNYDYILPLTDVPPDFFS